MSPSVAVYTRSSVGRAVRVSLAENSSKTSTLDPGGRINPENSPLASVHTQPPVVSPIVPEHDDP